jgi:hypothetical protein
MGQYVLQQVHLNKQVKERPKDIIDKMQGTAGRMGQAHDTHQGSVQPQRVEIAVLCTALGRMCSLLKPSVKSKSV